MEKRTKENEIMTGRRFGLLEVIEQKKTSAGISCRCRCDCGAEITLPRYRLLSGAYKSCGHINQERRYTDDERRIRKIWAAMHDRCERPETHGYETYGAAGITICKEWEQFEPFLEWSLSHGYRPDFTLDRKDNRQGYNPKNCRWVDWPFNCRHRENVVKVIDRWEVITLDQLAERYGLKARTVKERYRSGKRGADLIRPAGWKRIRVEIDGEEKLLEELAEETGINYNTLKDRYYHGKRGSELLGDVRGAATVTA